MKSFRLFCCLLLLGLALPGCQRNSGTTTGEEATSGGGKKYIIAVIPKATSQSFWLSVKAGAEKAAAEGDAKIDWMGPSDETDIARQIGIVDNAITRKVSAIVMAACDAHSLSASVAKAMKAGIPVVMIDSGITPDVSAAFLATDNIKGGASAGEALAKAIGEKGKVGLIPFVKGAASSDQREKGFRDAIAKFPGIELGNRVLYSNSDVSQGLQKTTAMITANPDIKGIFAANQGGAEGSIQAIRQLNLIGKVKLICFDASDVEVKALRDGVAEALIVQSPTRMGYEGVKTALKAIKKEKIEPKNIDTGVSIVTKANMDTPEMKELLK